MNDDPPLKMTDEHRHNAQMAKDLVKAMDMYLSIAAKRQPFILITFSDGKPVISSVLIDIDEYPTLFARIIKGIEAGVAYDTNKEVFVEPHSQS